MNLTQEEIKALEDSSLCLNCNHKEIFHNIDFEKGTSCNICGCIKLIVEGDYFREKYGIVYLLSQREFDSTKNTTLVIKRYNPLTLPLESLKDGTLTLLNKDKI